MDRDISRGTLRCDAGGLLIVKGRPNQETWFLVTLDSRRLSYRDGGPGEVMLRRYCNFKTRQPVACPVIRISKSVRMSAMTDSEPKGEKLTKGYCALLSYLHGIIAISSY